VPIELPKIDQAALDVAGKIFTEGRKNNQKQKKIDKAEWDKQFSLFHGCRCPVCKSNKLLQKKLKDTMLGHCINGHGGLWTEFITANQPKPLTKKQKDKLEKKAQNLRVRVKYALEKEVRKFCDTHLPPEDIAILKDKNASENDKKYVVHKHGLRFDWTHIKEGPRKGHWVFIKYKKDGKEQAYNKSLQIELQ